MGYFGLGQFGYSANPYSFGFNPFANYNNPFAGYDSAYAPIGVNGNNLSLFGGFGPDLSGYNFLNNPTPYPSFGSTNFGNTNSGFGNFNTGFGGSTFGNGFGNASLGGFGSFDSYNFLNSSATPVIQPAQNFTSFNQTQNLNNPYNFGNFGNFGLYNQTGMNFDTNTNTVKPKTNENADIKSKISSNKNGYGEEFLSKVKKISNNLNCNYKDLLAVMNAESGIKTTAVNKSTNATGLIQFMPKTAQGLGTSVDELKKMTPVEQLDYVEKYLQQTKRQAGFSADKKLSGGELYALVFRPAKAKTGIFATKGEQAYKLNEGLDLNKDGQVTMAELSKRVENFYVSDNKFIA